jgi:hypothetical protein
MSEIKPIETRYKGYRFRSRLEARWAVFFDALGIDYQYEPQGFIVGYDHRPYLPDFLLPKYNLYCEVKPTPEAFDWNLMLSCVDYGTGLPIANQNGGLLLLPNIPPPRWDGPDSMRPTYCVHEQCPVCLVHRKGVEAYLWSFGDRRMIHDCLGSWSDTGDTDIIPPPPDLVSNMVGDLGVYPVHGHKEVDRALLAARSARFEHGECG